MRTKSKLLIATLSAAILLPLGAFAASQSSGGHDVILMSTKNDQGRKAAVENYLKKTFGNEATASFSAPKDGTPVQVFTFPNYTTETGAVSEKTQETRTALKKLITDGTTENPWNCNTLHAYYFYGGDTLWACGAQGDEIDVPDFSTLPINMSKRGSSFWQGFSAGSADLYENASYSGYLGTVMSDTPIFGSYLNDKSASGKFSI